MGTTHEFETFDEILSHWAEERPETPAFQFGSRVTRFGELDRLTRQFVALFQAKGIARGQRIAWLGKNSDLFFILMLAAARCGVVMAPVGWRLAPPEIAYILSDTGAKLVFTDDGFEAVARQLADELENEPEVLGGEEALELARTMNPAEYESARRDDAVLQLYTSGTTGKPKGAVLSNGNLLGLRSGAIAAQQPWQTFEPADCMLVCMPCAHIGGTGLVVISIANGIKAEIQAEFAPEAVLEGIENGATHMFIVPAALQMVIQHPNAAQTDFSGLRYMMYGAAPMPLELLKQAVATMPQANFLQAYGMTETTGTISILPPEDHTLEGNERMRSAGKAVPGVLIKVCDPAGKELPRGEIGEIAIHSPSNMLGYWNLPEATRGTLDADGWVHTGDAAYMDEDGYIYIQDRIKDMIISGGENVYPAEVESAIYGHPAIAEVAVIGIPSERWGEEVKACIVLKPGQACEADEIIGYARDRVAAFKCPKSVDFIAEMPRNPSGKILRRQLRAPYWEGHDRQIG